MPISTMPGTRSMRVLTSLLRPIFMPAPRNQMGHIKEPLNQLEAESVSSETIQMRS